MLNDHYFSQLVHDICIVLEHYIRDNAKKFMEPNIHIQLINYATDVFSSVQNGMDIDIDLFTEYVAYAITEIIYPLLIPARHYSVFNIRFPTNFNDVHEKITALINVVQPAQRSPEWYIQRSNLITASNAYKAITSIANENSLILEKIKAYKALQTPPVASQTSDVVPQSIGYSGNETPFRYGIRNEPISVMYFEHCYNTKVGEFGCMIHKKYPFMGASPDGIIIDTKSNLYGTMLEIKNPITREITGTPKMDYWVQMQLQMEVCDLDNCLFLETHISYYDTYQEYMDDGTFQFSKDGHYKGVINEYKGEFAPHYEYLPFNATQEEYDNFEPNVNLDWVRNWYWKIDKVSCVLVKRNCEWFHSVIPQFCKIWDIIVKERETDDYSHRLPKQRIPKQMPHDIITTSPSQTQI
jgi:hypothetical protein